MHYFPSISVPKTTIVLLLLMLQFAAPIFGAQKFPEPSKGLI
jgi:hypothetical protein